MRVAGCALFVAAVMAAPVSLHAQTTYNVTLTGAQEVPGPGDSDGFGSGTLTLDPVLDQISWNITYENLTGQAMSGFHIHGPLPDLPSQQSAGIRVFLDIIQPLGPIPNGTISGTLTDALDPSDLSAKIDEILAAPAKYYLNIHTSHIGTTGQGGFPSGAIRGAVPEPGTLGLVAIGSLGLLRRARRLNA